MIEKLDANKPYDSDLFTAGLALQEYRATKVKINEIIDVINTINRPIFVQPVCCPHCNKII